MWSACRYQAGGLHHPKKIESIDCVGLATMQAICTVDSSCFGSLMAGLLFVSRQIFMQNEGQSPLTCQRAWNPAHDEALWDCAHAAGNVAGN